MSIENKKFEKETIKNSESKENKRNFEREQKRKEIIYSKIETSESLAELEELIKK
jgi:pyruvate kinase